MNIFDLAWKVIFMFITGLLVISTHFLIHGIPLLDIPVDEKTAFIAGILITIFSHPIYRYFLKNKLQVYSEEISVAAGAIFIFGLLQLFPIGIPYGKLLLLDNKDTQAIKKDDNHLEKLFTKAEKEGKNVIFLKREGFYIMTNPERTKKELYLPYIANNIVEEIRYGTYLINIPDERKILIIEDKISQIKNISWFLLSVGGIYLLINILGAVKEGRKKKERKTKAANLYVNG